MKNKHILLALLLTMGIVTNVGATGNDAGASSYLIFNNTNSNSDKSIYTNLFTGNSNECSKDSALYETNCNSFSLGSNELQIIQSDTTGNLINHIGINNSDVTSYKNSGTENQLNFFTPGQHIFELDKFRNASDEITKLSAGTPVGTYGTISFQQFINNVANARPMYGIVRVKIPLIKTLRTEDSKNKKEHEREDDDDHEKDDSKSKSEKEMSSSMSLQDLSSFFIKESIASEENDDKERSKYVYKLCGEKPTPECLLCGPGIGTDIKPGQSVCGVKLNANSKILVYGSLFFDWVDCKTENPVSLDDLPSRPRDIYFSISVPINVNPSNVDPATGTMASLPKIPQIIGNNKCPSGSPCNLPINTTVPLSLISQEARDQFQYDTGKILNETLFNSMTPAQKFSLLFPSGYEDGWAKAFNTLGITPGYWQSLGFNTPSSSGFIDANQVRSSSFEDIPAYMYTGGLVDMHHHVNISGLVYVPQAIELEQKGQTFGEKQECTKVKQKHDDEDHDDREKEDDSHSESKSKKSKTSSRSLASRTSEEKESDDKEHDDQHEDENKSACISESDDSEKKDSEDDHKEADDDHDKGDSDKKHDDHGSGSGTVTFIPASQYINGMILVRDSFYIEAKQPGGITIFNNDPNTYSNIALSTSSAIGGKFQLFPLSNIGGGSTGDNTNGNNNSSGGNSSGDSSDSSGNSGSNSGNNGNASGESTPNRSPGAEWVEIRPQ